MLSSLTNFLIQTFSKQVDILVADGLSHRLCQCNQIRGRISENCGFSITCLYMLDLILMGEGGTYYQSKGGARLQMVLGYLLVS
jgi:hypothetical protein